MVKKEKETTMWITKDTIYIILNRDNAQGLAEELNEDIHDLIVKALEKGARGQYFVTPKKKREREGN